MSDVDKQTVGRLGEDAAAAFLQKNGFTVIHRNVHISHKEIDLIAQNEQELVFVEVKTRRQDPHARSPFGRPVDAVDSKKRKNVASAAQTYLYHHPTTRMPRIDVIEVFISPKDPPCVVCINWYKNAFGAGGQT